MIGNKPPHCPNIICFPSIKWRFSFLPNDVYQIVMNSQWPSPLLSVHKVPEK